MQLPQAALCTVQAETSRVRGKLPYKELKGEGEVRAQADEAWMYDRSRRNSVITDVFAGQFQTTVTCSACGVESHTFEDFLDISLPLPEASHATACCSIEVKYDRSHAPSNMQLYEFP